MIENLEFEEFFRGMRSNINDEVGDSLEEGYRVNRFTEFFTNHLGDFGIITDANIYSLDKSYGSGRIHANAWYLDEEEGRLSLFVTDFYDEEEVCSVSRSEVEKTIKRAIKVFNFVKKININELEPASLEYIMFRTINEAIDKISQIRIYYITDGITKKITTQNDIYDEIPVYIDIWDIQRLYRLLSSGREYEPVEIDFEKKFSNVLKCISMPSNTNEYQGYLSIIPGDILEELYEEYGSRLMELNVRSFLQQRGKVNRGIRQTILNEPHRFLAYNNGISATAESIDTERNQNGDLVIKKIKGLQIVNGGQTVASLHRAKKYDRSGNLDKIAVQAKISVVKKDMLEELVPKISRFSNTQNSVNEADFASNDPFHIDIEKLANNIWVPGEQSRWFYERARGQYEVARNRVAGTSVSKRKKFDEQIPKNQKFTKTDLAKYFNCWAKLPHIVALGSQKCFVHFMTHLVVEDKNFTPDEVFYKNLVSMAIIYKEAERVARKHKFPGYRANAVAYTMALISYKTFGRIELSKIWLEQSISTEFKDLMSDWMPIVRNKIIETAGERNVTEWAKKIECWNAVQLIDVEMPETFEKELTEGDRLPNVGVVIDTARADIGSVDRMNIARTMQIDKVLWRQISDWGQENNQLETYHYGIANTLALYAAGNWDKVPSVKQARQAVKILDIYKNNKINNNN